MGGNAIKCSVPIADKNVSYTIIKLIDDVFSKLGIYEKDVELIGSAGKKQQNSLTNDIDIAVQVPVNRMNEIYEQLKKLSAEVYLNRGTKIISFAFPEYYLGGITYNYAQIDLMFVDNLKFAHWMYYAPDWGESKYKGVYRNKLMFSILKYAKYKLLDWTTDSIGNEIELTWKKYVLNMNSGLHYVKQTREGRKNNILKNPKTIESTFITDSPDMIRAIMLGNLYSLEDTYTFEKLISIVRSYNFKYKSIVGYIINDFCKACKDSNLEIPIEVEKYNG